MLAWPQSINQSISTKIKRLRISSILINISINAVAEDNLPISQTAFSSDIFILILLTCWLFFVIEVFLHIHKLFPLMELRHWIRHLSRRKLTFIWSGVNSLYFRSFILTFELMDIYGYWWIYWVELWQNKINFLW